MNTRGIEKFELIFDNGEEINIYPPSLGFCEIGNVKKTLRTWGNDENLHFINECEFFLFSLYSKANIKDVYLGNLWSDISIFERLIWENNFISPLAYLNVKLVNLSNLKIHIPKRRLNTHKNNSGDMMFYYCENFDNEKFELYKNILDNSQFNTDELNNHYKFIMDKRGKNGKPLSTREILSKLSDENYPSLKIVKNNEVQE
jgi:hypothetical protein